jgi:tRNA threonylcarbamoyladenosine biosynthesis protein TsaB
MLILALDTTTKASSCAVARDGIVIREAIGDDTRSPSARLPGDLMALLADANLTLPAIDACAVATGPGSFTGLRVGIATMQGLAFALGKPLAGVSGFDALAHAVRLAPDAAAAAEGERIATWVDAWRGEVYAALYDGARQVEPPVVARPDDLLRDLAGRPTRFVGDGAASFRDLIAARMGAAARFAAVLTPPLAGAIAQLAAAHGEWAPPDAIRPLYVRRTDAELARDRDA